MSTFDDPTMPTASSTTSTFAWRVVGVEVDLHAGPHQVVVIGPPGEPDHLQVGPLRDDEPHVYPPQGRVFQGGPDRVVRNEVGGLHPDPLPRGGEGGEQPLVDGAQGAVRSRGDHLHRGRPSGVSRGGGKGWEEVSRRSGLLRGEGPVVQEEGLQVPHGGPPDHDRAVPPPVRVGPGAHVPLPDVHPAGEGAPSVDDQQLPVVSEVGGPFPVQREGGEELRHLPPGLPQRSDEAPKGPPGSHGVEEKTDMNPCSRAGREGVEEPLSDRVHIEDEELRVNMVARLLDLLEEGSVGLFPAGDEDDPVSVHRRRRPRREKDPPAGRRDLAGEALRADTVLHGALPGAYRVDLCPDMSADPAPPDQIVERNPHDREERDGKDPGDRRGGLTPLHDDPGDQEEGEEVPQGREDERGDPPTVVHGSLPKR